MKKFQHNIIFPLLVLLFAGFLNGQTYTFTNAGAEGREGPTQAQIDANYSGTNLDGKVTINTRGIQEWVVPFSGTYQIQASGAQGGTQTYQNGFAGGKGALMIGSFELVAGEDLSILVGQMGENTRMDKSNAAPGGGGGTYIWKTYSYNLHITASGGGGGGRDSNLGIDGNSSTSGNDSQNVDDCGGLDGNGSRSNAGGSSYWAGGGAGWFTNGTGGNKNTDYDFNATDRGGKGGRRPLEGGFGGERYSDGYDEGGDGGFGGGGGGGSANMGTGGGGGYSGGGGARGSSGNATGGGGGSYNSGTDQNNTSGANEGHGKVIIIFLGAANESPVISQGTGPISKVTSEDTLTTFSANELNATDSDTNASQLAWSLLSSPSNGTAIIDGNGSSPQVFTYQPNANYHGADSFSVQVSDGDANDSITINLTVNPVDDPAVISGDTSGFLLEDSSLTGDLNATDSDGLTDGTYFSIASSPSSGSLSINQETGRWTYYPNSDTFGSETFTVTVTDDQNFTATQVINLNVISVNDLTSLTGDFNGTTNEDNSISGDINATDIDGLTDGSYFSISLNPSNGIAAVDHVDGNWSYSPSANSFGSDSFTVTITDDQGYTATQVISLSINSVDDISTITGDSNASIAEDSFASGDLNATDIDGLTDGSYFTISSNPGTGSASIDPVSGAWSYSPSANVFGTDSFTVTVTDDLNFTAVQVISVIINAVDDPTVITGDISGALFLDHPVSGDLNATDIDGLSDGSYFSIFTPPSSGTATVDPATGNWNYTPLSGFLGDDSFVIQITDDQGFMSNQSITIIPQYNVAVAKTGQPTILANGNAQLSASIIFNGGLPILEVGFYTSTSSQFSSSEKLSATLDNNASFFTADLNRTDLTSALFVRAFARNQNGQTLGEIKRLAPPPIVMHWSSHATALDTGWLQSDWFGTFRHYPKNWIFHSRLGWLYIPDTSSQNLWIWSPEHSWLWTQKGIFPHLYKNSTGAWIYLLNQETQGKNIYDYQSGLFK